MKSYTSKQSAGRQSSTKPMHAEGMVTRIKPPKSEPYSKQPKHCKECKM